MKNITTITVLFCVILIACGQKGKNIENKAWVYDFENVLTDTQIQVLDSIIGYFEMKTTNEIVIVTVDNIGDSPKMVDFAVEFGEKWGVRKKDKNNGLVILFSRNMRQTFIATGYGTEKILKDEICKAIIDSTMIPFFKQEDYYGGLRAGVEECIRRWK